MRYNFIKICLLFFLIGLLSLSISGCLDSNKNKNVIAVVNGDNIFTHDLERALRDFTRMFGKDKPLPPNEYENIKKISLSKLIEKKLLLQEVKKLHISLSRDEINKRLETITKDYPELKFKDVLIKNRITFQEWRDNMIEDMLIERLIEREVNSKISVNEEELRRYYNSSPEEFYKPVNVHALQILVATEDEAKEIRKELLKGMDFQDMARSKSIGPEGKNGGDLGVFSKGNMPDWIDENVFNLKIAEISNIIKTPYGYHIFKVIERNEGKVMNFEEVYEIIKKKITEEKQKKEFNRWITDLKNRSSIILTGEN